jgi:hypothetical protein
VILSAGVAHIDGSRDNSWLALGPGQRECFARSMGCKERVNQPVSLSKGSRPDWNSRGLAVGEDDRVVAFHRRPAV